MLKRFSDLESHMRQFETYLDFHIPPGMFIIVRLDGKGFTNLTKEQDFEKPFDFKFKEIMTHVMISLMRCTGFSITYGYTQSDEISLLFSLNEDTFNRKTRKINSVLAGYASSFFYELAKTIGVFDCRVITPTSIDEVVNYFLWRQEDANRNALSGYCYWALRKYGHSKGEATSILNKASVADKNELLHEKFGINYTHDVPLWQKRGIGAEWVSFSHKGKNPITNKIATTTRRRIDVREDLPMKDEYAEYIRSKL